MNNAKLASFLHNNADIMNEYWQMVQFSKLWIAANEIVTSKRGRS